MLHSDSRAASLRETHISVVLLLGDRAYKLKKPIVTGFLDYSTQELREAACHREVELNRRLEPDVYLGVADVSGPDGKVCDHLVVMKRLPAERSLDSLVRAGADIDADLRQVARKIATFHAGADRSAVIDGAGSADAVLANWEENFTEMAPFVGPALDAGVARRVELLARRYIDGRRRLLSSRIAGGLVVDGHGDLRADNIFCLEDGPRVLDCIEFSDRLRHGDVLADVAFLAMDLERLGRPDLAGQLLRWYAEFSAEHHPVSLEHHFVAYRAHVRTKVACIRQAQGDEDAKAEAESLLEIAASHLHRGRVRLVLLGGTPGTGKSTLAGGVADSEGFSVLSSDRVRKELAGIGSSEPAPAEFGQGIYSLQHTAATYTELLQRARRLLEMGESVILDASWRDSRWRTAARAVAAETFTDLIQLRCTLPLELSQARIAERRAAGGVTSDADERIAEMIAASFQPWPGAVEVPTDDDSGGSLARVLAAVA